jgi:signal transduction histidine kinase
VAVAQVDRQTTDAELAARLGPRILEWARERDPDELLSIADPRGGGTLHIAARPLGFNAAFGVIAAGFAESRPPGPLEFAMLGIGATQAAAAVQNARLLSSLREADRRKDEFLAMLGHELRNPLAPIATAIQLMRLRGTDSPELATLERQTAHLKRLVDDLLDVSRITRGKIELRRQRVEIADAVLRAMEMAAPLLEPRAHRVDIESVPRTGLAVDADPDRLAQVVFNLLSNAAKYSPRGSPIVLRAWREAGRVLFSVKDDGMGIPPELIERVFDMFVQHEQALARSEGGLGLGLTIVRSLVELHGGQVIAKSAGVGKGSEFTVELPAARAPASPVASPAAPPARAPGRRVLVVDDNVDAAGALEALLKTLGHDVLVVHDGPAALSSAPAFRPEIALLDIGLPGMDGYELARRFTQRCAGTKLVALTGYGLESDRARSAQAGFSEHLVKPVELARLDQVLRGAGA